MANRMQKYHMRSNALGMGKQDDEQSSESSSAPIANKNHDHKVDQPTKYDNITKDINDGVNDPVDLQNFLKTDKPTGHFRSFFLSMCMETPKVQQEKIIMLAEAYALFAALFLNGVWFIWEYGNSKDFKNESLHRAFEAICAINMISTVLISLYGCFAWIMSILFAHNKRSWAYGNRRCLACFQHLVHVIGFCTLSGLAIAVYNRLQGFVEGYVLVAFAGLYSLAMTHEFNVMMAEQIPLEFFHCPLYIKLSFFADLWCQKKDQIQKQAAVRSKELEQLSSRDERQQKQESKGIDELRTILQDACGKLGKSDIDVSPYLAKLQEDWYDNVDHLRGKDVDVLNKYMPRLLAETLSAIINPEE